MSNVTLWQLLTVIGMSMLPLIELKGSIIAGVAMGMPLAFVFVISYLFSSLPVPFILWLLKPIMNYLKKIPKINKFYERQVQRVMEKSGRIQKYSYLGLFVFVAIPLPGTGVWSGSLIASVLDLDFKKASISIIAGNFIAGFLILALAQFGVILLK